MKSRKEVVIDSNELNQELLNLRGDSDDDKESVNSQNIPIRKHSDSSLQQLDADNNINTDRQALSEGNQSEKDSDQDSEKNDSEDQEVPCGCSELVQESPSQKI